MRIQHILFLLLLNLVHGYGQTPLTLETFLAKADQTENVAYQNKKLTFLNTAPHSLPMIKDLEFRTELNDFDLRRQEYLVRVNFNGFRNINAYERYHGTLKNITALEMELARATDLRARYDVLVDYIFHQNILTVQNKLQLLYEDKLTLLKRSISLPGFDVLDLIKAEAELQKKEQDIFDLENLIAIAEQFTLQLSNESQTPLVIKEQLVSVEELASIFQNHASSSEPKEHLNLAVLSAEKESRQLDYEWEQAKSKFSVGFIQAKYSDNEDDIFKEKFSVGLGFDIPLKSTDRLDLNKLQLEIFTSENQYNYIKQQLLIEKAANRTQLQSLIDKYHFLQEQLENNTAETVIKDYSGLAELAPAALLELRENTLNKELLLAKTKLELMKVYIHFLDLEGSLVQQPLKNYLYK